MSKKKDDCIEEQPGWYNGQFLDISHNSLSPAVRISVSFINLSLSLCI